jgi:hypothetical protein
MTMKTVNRWWCKSFIYLVGSVLVWGLSAGIVQAEAENHNTTRSNKTMTLYPGPGSSGGSISPATIKTILDELDKTPAHQVNEQRVRDLLRKNGVTGIKKIIVEPGERGLFKIILLQDPGNEAAAQKAWKRTMSIVE